MAADTLTDAEARALRLCAEGLCLLGNVTTPHRRPTTLTVVRVHASTARRLYERGLVKYVDGLATITPAGREALARHEANDAANDDVPAGAARRTEAGDRRG